MGASRSETLSGERNEIKERRARGNISRITLCSRRRRFHAPSAAALSLYLREIISFGSNDNARRTFIIISDLHLPPFVINSVLRRLHLFFNFVRLVGENNDIFIF